MPFNLLLAAGLLGFAAQSFAAPCSLTWDGERLGNYAKSRPLSDTIPLKGQNNEVKTQVTARQVLAFVEAKDVVTQQIGRTAKLVVCSDEAPNAFATRGKDGGEVMGVTVGMLNLLDGDRDAAAMVVGHEFAHHEKNHLEASRNRNAAIGFLGAIAGAILEVKTQQKTGLQGLGMNLADLGATLVSRKFDRDQEREADELGFKHVVDAGFNPKGAIRLSDRMARVGPSSGLFFDTHPGWSERSVLIQRYIDGSDAAREIMAKSSDFTPFASARVPNSAQVSIVALYESTDAEKSYADGMAAFRRNETANGVDHIRAASNAGHSKAQVYLGHMLLYGTNGVEKNEVESARLFHLAADKGEPTAINNLGVMASKGFGGIQKNDAEALALYKRAMEMGNGLSAKNIGDGYFNGSLGLEKDLVQAVAMYRKAEELGSSEGSIALGIMYGRGEGGLPRDFALARDQYSKVADRGIALGRYRKGYMLIDGREGVPQDEAAGLALIRQAADQGYALAQNDLGAYYMKGIHGVAQSESEGLKGYQASAKQNHAMAQANLGYLYLNGRAGLAKDPNEAARYFKLASAQGNPGGDFGLGLLNETGEGGFTKDKDAAIALYRRAADKGNKAAADKIKKLGG